MSTEDKLFRILRIADARKYDSKTLIAREIAKRESSEFQYLRNGTTHMCSVAAIGQYVSLAQQIGLFTEELRPVVSMKGARDEFRAGFNLMLMNNVVGFAQTQGFSPDKLADIVGRMMRKRPAQVPSLRSIFDGLKVQCSYTVFRRIVLMGSYSDETKIKIGLRQVMMIPNVLEE